MNHEEFKISVLYIKISDKKVLNSKPDIFFEDNDALPLDFGKILS